MSLRKWNIQFNNVDIAFINLYRRLLLQHNQTFQFSNFKILKYKGKYPIDLIKHKISSIPINALCSSEINVLGPKEVTSSDISLDKELMHILITYLDEGDELHITFESVLSNDRICSNFEISHITNSNIELEIKNPHFSDSDMNSILQKINNIIIASIPSF
jgi:hypothetical protein